MVPVGIQVIIVDKKLLLINYDLTTYGIIMKNNKNMSKMNACLCAHKEDKTNTHTHAHTNTHIKIQVTIASKVNSQVHN